MNHKSSRGISAIDKSVASSFGGSARSDALDKQWLNMPPPPSFRRVESFCFSRMQPVEQSWQVSSQCVCVSVSVWAACTSSEPSTALLFLFNQVLRAEVVEGQLPVNNS